MQINKLLTPYNLNRLGDTNRIRYIVIHYVGATGGAEANCRYYASKYIGASAHYYVGFGGEIWQSVEDGDIAWHCRQKVTGIRNVGIPTVSVLSCVSGIKEARQQTAGTGTSKMLPFRRLLN